MQIGRLLDRLKELDLWDNTIVILWGDHGWKLGEHNSWCKMTNYEIDTRVPLIVRQPGAQENGQRCDRLVEFVDVFPSLCDLAGLPVPVGLDGVSFAPLLENRRLPWKNGVFSQFLRDGIWTAPDGRPYHGYTIRTDRFRYVGWYHAKTRKVVGEELYDHRTDPLETKNIIKSQPKIATQLRRRLKAGWAGAVPNQ